MPTNLDNKLLMQETKSCVRCSSGFRLKRDHWIAYNEVRHGALEDVHVMTNCVHTCALSLVVRLGNCTSGVRRAMKLRIKRWINTVHSEEDALLCSPYVTWDIFWRSASGSFPHLHVVYAPSMDYLACHCARGGPPSSVVPSDCTCRWTHEAD